jgi:hypothetical protein
MAKEAVLHDGTILEFPDNTSDDVIDRTVKSHINTWGNVGKRAVKNFLPDVGNLVIDSVNSLIHPIDTTKNVLNIANSAVQNVLPDSINELMYKINQETRENKAIVPQIGEKLKEASGSEDAIKNTLAEHPAQVLSLLSPALGLAGKASGVNALVKAGRAIDPLYTVGKVAGPVIKKSGGLVGTVVGELGTHTGGETIRDAARAGYQGGDKLNELTGFMRDKRVYPDIVANAEKGLRGIAQKDSDAYNLGMASLKQNQTILPYGDIEAALKSASNTGKYEGHTVSPAAVNVANELKPIIEEWSGKPIPSGPPIFDIQTNTWIQPTKPGFDPSKAHTIEGLDQLKKRVGEVYEKTDQDTPERKVARKVYNAVKSEINKVSPEYGELMKKSQNAIKRRNEFKGELSLKENATDSTKLRKLLAVPRNNANTNYGNRVALAKLLEENGADNLMSQLNGAALSSIKPRGLGGVIGGGSVLGALAAALTGNPGLAAALVGGTLTQSPRLMGEAAILAGKGGKVTSKAMGPSVKAATIRALLANQQGVTNE